MVWEVAIFISIIKMLGLPQHQFLKEIRVTNEVMTTFYSEAVIQRCSVKKDSGLQLYWILQSFQQYLYLKNTFSAGFCSLQNKYFYLLCFLNSNIGMEQTWLEYMKSKTFTDFFNTLMLGLNHLKEDKSKHV